MLHTTALRALVTTASLCIAATAYSQGYTHVVAFGDSLTDRGNTVEAARFFGVDMNEVGYDDVYYDFDEATGEPASGRWSNGPTWVEYLNAKVLGGPSATTPVDLGRNDNGANLGTNFAWAGTTSGTGNQFILFGPNLLDQVGQYGGQTLAGYASTTLFTVWSGGNDAIDWVENTSRGDIETATSTAAANVAQAVSNLYAMNGRSFVVPNLPALGFKPNFIGTEFEELANDFAEMFNMKLSLELAALDLEDALIIELDVYSVFNDILGNPEEYGFTEVDTAAFLFADNNESTVVENWEDHVFWDNTHPTTRVHEILGNLAYQQAIPEPSTFVLIGAGAALGYAFRRRLAA